MGFTAGIGVIIFASQLKDLFGLVLPGKEPGALLPKLSTLAQAWPTAGPAAMLVAALSIAIILAVRRVRPHWPALLLAVVFASLVGMALIASGARLATIGTAFGGIPHALPAPRMPTLSIEKVVAVLPMALSFALLGSIESLLSAVVADSMSGRRHRSNMELVAQGVANVGSALFGGICVTGTIARTATNVRAGARGPVAGMLHARLPAAVPGAGGTAGQRDPVGRAGGGSGGRVVEHDRAARDRDAAAGLTRGCAGAGDDVPAGGVP